MERHLTLGVLENSQKQAKDLAEILNQSNSDKLINPREKHIKDQSQWEIKRADPLATENYSELDVFSAKGNLRVIGKISQSNLFFR